MKVPSNIRKTALVAAVTLAITGIPTLDNDFNLQVGFSSVISSAYAAQGAGSAGGHKGGAMGGQQGGQREGGQGGQYKGGRSAADILAEDGEEEDSDRPPWAAGGDGEKPGGGNKGGNTQKGDDFGDLVVLEREDDGTPTGNVIIYEVDAEGNILRDAEGNLIISRIEPIGDELPALEPGEAFLPVEVGRLNVSRSPTSVTDHSLAEALSKLDGLDFGTDVTLDPSGRLVVDGNTIDSPLENLALYEALLTTEAIEGSITLSVTTTKDGGDTTYSFVVPEEVRLDLAASAIAAASDKTGDLTIDEIMFTTATLGEEAVEGLTSLVGGYVYDPAAYDGLQVYILEPTADPDVFNRVLVNVASKVDLGTVDDGSIFEDGEGGIDDFANAANDAVQVLEYVHDNAVE